MIQRSPPLLHSEPTEATGQNHVSQLSRMKLNSRDRSNQGLLLGFMGVCIFSFSMPFTKIAVTEMNPLFVVSFRSTIAGILGLAWLYPKRKEVLKSLPELKHSLFWQITGVVIGFPVLSSIALKTSSSSHGALVIATTPILTSVLSASVFKIKRSLFFWLCAISATITVITTVFYFQGMHLIHSDWFLFLASVLVAIGYTFGADSTSKVGGATSISLAVATCLPLSAIGLVVFAPEHMPSFKTLAAASYLGVFSMFAGFIFWYEGLSRGRSEQVSLIQSFQLFLTYITGYFILGEAITYSQILPSLLVAAFIFASKLAK